MVAREPVPIKSWASTPMVVAITGADCRSIQEQLRASADNLFGELDGCVPMFVGLPESKRNGSR